MQELRRCMLELGFKGVQIGSHINGWNLDAPELDVFWKVCFAYSIGDGCALLVVDALSSARIHAYLYRLHEPVEICRPRRNWAPPFLCTRGIWRRTSG